MADLLTQCVRTRVQKEKRSVFRFTQNMSGILCMGSMRRQALSARKPASIAELFAGCQTESIIKKFEPVDRSFSLKRAPCTCALREPLEQWQLSIYNPLTKQTFKHVMAVDQVRQMLRGIEWAAKVMRTSTFAQDSLQGSSFDHLTPLFSEHTTREDSAAEDDAFSGRRLDRSFSKALLSSAEESSVLPRMPLLLPSVVSDVINQAGRHEYALSEYFRSSVLGSQQVTRFGHTGMVDGRRSALSDPELGGAEPLWNWHPLVDMTKLKLEVARHCALSQAFGEALAEAVADEQACEQQRVVLLVRMERAQMQYEDSFGVLVRAADFIQAASDKIVQVMKYCKKLEMDVTMEERGKQLDDHQSYKDLEDANMWVGLNEKRRLEQLYVTQFEHCNTNFEAFYNISVAFSACDEALKRAKITRFTMRARFDAHEPEIALRSGMLRQLQVETRAAAAAVLSTFSLPRKHPSYAVKKKQDRGQSGDGSPIAVSEIPEEGVLAPVR